MQLITRNVCLIKYTVLLDEDITFYQGEEQFKKGANNRDLERSQPTSALIVSFINHTLTDSDVQRLFISLLHTGATTTNSATAVQNIWE